MNRLSQVTDIRTAGSTNYDYDQAGSLSGYVYQNGVRTSFAYDNLDRLTKVTIGRPNTIASYEYSLGQAGERLSLSETGGRTVHYSCDSLYRLTNEAVINDPISANNGGISYTMTQRATD